MADHSDFKSFLNRVKENVHDSAVYYESKFKNVKELRERIDRNEKVNKQVMTFKLASDIEKMACELENQKVDQHSIAELAKQFCKYVEDHYSIFRYESEETTKLKLFADKLRILNNEDIVQSQNFGGSQPIQNTWQYGNLGYANTNPGGYGNIAGGYYGYQLQQYVAVPQNYYASPAHYDMPTSSTTSSAPHREVHEQFHHPITPYPNPPQQTYPGYDNYMDNEGEEHP